MPGERSEVVRAEAKAGRWLTGASLAVAMGFALVAWFAAPPLLSSDSASGLVAWRSMLAGGPWNSVVAPSPHDIGEDRATFLTWWSPGQFLVTGVAIRVMPSVAAALTLTSLLATVAAAFGIRHLTRVLGGGEKAAGLAMLATTLNWHSLQSFGVFIGGESLLAACLPWTLAAVARTQASRWRAVPLVLIAFLAGLLAKHAFVLVIATSCLWCLWETPWRAQPWKKSIRHVLPVTAAAGLAWLLSQWLWVRGGPTPGDATSAAEPVVTSIGYAFAGPWLAFTGAGSVIGRLFFLTGIENGWHSLGAWLSAGALGMTILFAAVTHRQRHHSLIRVAWCGLAVVSVLMAWLYVRGASVSFEDRHFRTAALLIPAALAMTVCDSAAKRRPRQIATALLAIACLIGPVAAVQRIPRLMALDRGPISGCTQVDLSPDAWRKISDASENAVLFLPDTPLSVEFPQTRLIVTDAAARPAAELSEWRYAGRVPRLVVTLPKRLEADGRAALILAAFTDYADDDWVRVEAGNWLIWVADATGGTP